VFFGGYDNETLSGGAGADTLRGRKGNDVLSGGTGNDVLSGEGGDDTYLFSRGDGQDIIRDYVDSFEGGGQGTDTILLGANISPSDVRVTQADSGYDIVLSIIGTTDQITLDQTANSENFRVERVQFADGTVWTAAEMQTMATTPTGGNDVFFGGLDNDTLSGAAGADTLRGRYGHDILIGGTGNDTLSGEGGDDTYRFALGDGQDIVRDLVNSFDGGVNGTDAIEFGAGITPGMVTVTQADGGRDLILKLTGTTDQITLDDTLASSGYQIELVKFVDGTIWTSSDLLQRATGATPGNDTLYGGSGNETLAGLAGNDTLLGRSGNDLLIGGTGNDTLSGEAGDDTYRFERGDGQDIVRDYAGAGANGFDTLEFGDTILPADVTVTQADGGNDFVFTINGTTDRVTIDQAINYSPYYIEQVRFADGTIWSAADLLTRSITPTSGNDNFAGGRFNDTISGGTGNDTIRGRYGNDILIGGTGNDFLSGDGDNDIFRFGLGDGQDIVSDYINAIDNGGGGSDFVEFLTGITPSMVSVSQADNGNDLILTITGTMDRVTLDQTVNDSRYRIEEVRFANGTAWNAALLLAMATTPSNGNDTFFGSYDNDSLSGDAGNDSLIALSGNDLINGGIGNDYMDGGSGTDTVDYAERSTPVTVNLSITTAQTIAAGESETLLNIENVTGGSADDLLVGSTAVNVLQGGAGNDRLIGGAGNDTVLGGTGTNDIAVFAGLQASYSIVTNNGVVTVTDNQPTVDGNDGTDIINGIEKVEFKGGVQVGVTSPIILDLDGQGIVTTSADQGHARFDMDGDGIADRTSWIGRNEGFLFLDRDGNDTLSGVGEMSFVNDVPYASSDLVGLRAFDSNGDGSLSETDADFARFKVWQDRNGDGRVGTNEVLTLTQAGVVSLNLTAVAVNASSAFGDVAVVNRGNYQRTDGSTMMFYDAVLTYFPGSIAAPGSRKPGWAGKLAVAAPLESEDSQLLRNSEADPLAFIRRTVGVADFASLIESLDRLGSQSNAAIHRAEVSIQTLSQSTTLETLTSAFPQDAALIKDSSARLLALLRQDMASFQLDRGMSFGRSQAFEQPQGFAMF
jgi:Ca2+-binding RTX toxin-like protein